MVRVIAALSPLQSWAVVVALLLLVVFFAWAYLDGAARMDRIERRLDRERMSREWLERWHRQNGGR